MHTYWIFVRNESGTAMKIEIQGRDNYQAIQLAKALYGSRLLSESANLIR
jgi:hypothetical protein